MSTILEIESAVQQLPIAEARVLHEWLSNYIRHSETSFERVIADTWEKLGPAPDIDYDQI